MLIIHMWKRKKGKKDSFNKKYIHIRYACNTWEIFSLTKKVREKRKHTDIDDNIYDFRHVLWPLWPLWPWPLISPRLRISIIRHFTRAWRQSNHSRASNRDRLWKFWYWNWLFAGWTIFTLAWVSFLGPVPFREEGLKQANGVIQRGGAKQCMGVYVTVTNINTGYI